MTIYWTVVGVVALAIFARILITTLERIAKAIEDLSDKEEE